MSRPFTPIHVMTEAFRKAMYDIVAGAQEKQRQSTMQEQKMKEGKYVHNEK